MFRAPFVLQKSLWNQSNGTIYNLISEKLISKSVSFDKLVAQTYDGASNMSGCYNGLQAIIKEKVGEHVAFVHCYAHTLNLV